MLDEEDMLKLIRAYEVADKLQEAMSMISGINESYGTGCFKDLYELEEVIIKHSVPEMRESVHGMEPWGYVILQGNMVPEAKVDYLLGKRFCVEKE